MLNTEPILNSGAQIQDRGAAMAKAAEKRFFHWFLEFPEVFSDGGFDCILGNPPYLGGSKISGAYGKYNFSFIKSYYQGIKGQSDLVSFFIRRYAQIISNKKFFSIITTNTVSQGDTRLGGLDYLLKNDFSINFAIKNITWPGKAAVQVSLISIFKGRFSLQKKLNGNNVDEINSYLDNSPNISPLKLTHNQKICFKGTSINGDGFIIRDEQELIKLKKEDIKNEYLYKFIIGNDINNLISINNVDTYIINFWDYPLSKAKKFPEALNIIEERVKPKRLKNSSKSLREKWWIYERLRPDLYEKIKIAPKIFTLSLSSKYLNFTVGNRDYVYSNSTGVLALNSFFEFMILQSSIHLEWAWRNSSTLGSSTLSYTISDSFETFPFPIKSVNINSRFKPKNLIDYRNIMMEQLNLGLTDSYNQFHNKGLCPNVGSKSPIEFQKKYGKETWNLYNHLEVKEAGNISYEEAVPLIFKLRELHKEMDKAVLEAYGWHTDTERWGKAIDLRHDFYEVDYLPENDRVRYTIHPEARKEVLKRLLLLNHEMHEGEERNITYEELDVEKTLEIYKGHIKDWLPANNSLHAKTLKFLSSAQELLPTLGSSTAQSYKPFVNQYCSALENELQQKIFVAFNEHFQSQWIGKVEEKNSHLKEQMALSSKASMLFKALKSNSDKYTLGNMHFFLNLIWNENSNTVKASPLMQEFKTFAFKRYSDKFINKETVAKLDAFIKKFRNESAHTGEVDKNMAVECMHEVRGFIKLLVESEILPEKKVEVKSTKKKTRKIKKNVVKEPHSNYGQGSLFEEANLFNQDSLIGFESKVTIQKKDGTSFKYHISKNALKGKFTGEYKQITPSSSLAENMFGRKVGHSFLFGGLEYKILKLE